MGQGYTGIHKHIWIISIEYGCMSDETNTQTEVECFTKTQPEMVKEMYFYTPCSSTFRLISPRMP